MNHYKNNRQDLAANFRDENMCDDIEKVIKQNRIFCFGAGIIGKNFLECIKGSSIENKIVNFVDSDINLIGKRIDFNGNKIDIISRNDFIQKVTEQDAIIITLGSKTRFEVFAELSLEKNLHNNNIYFVNFFRIKTTKSQLGLNIANAKSSIQKHCTICGKETSFIKIGKVARYDYYCMQCGSVPRQRALVYALNKFLPNWKKSNIHEPSSYGAASDYIRNNCINYTFSHFFYGFESGEFVNYLGENYLCQNIENMSFEDESFDIFITQDVFEHVLNPKKAFKEIERVLKKGGVHIFTIPWFYENNNTLCRAKQGENNEIIYLEKPIYHGNPVDKEGSLVVNDWGFDIVEVIYTESGMQTTVFLCENVNSGIEGDFLEVFISKKNN